MLTGEGPDCLVVIIQRAAETSRKRIIEIIVEKKIKEQGRQRILAKQHGRLDGSDLLDLNHANPLVKQQR